MKTILEFSRSPIGQRIGLWFLGTAAGLLAIIVGVLILLAIAAIIGIFPGPPPH